MLPPVQRPVWAERMRDLLSWPNGRLICVEYPTCTPLSDGGPPYFAPLWCYQLHLTHPGDGSLIDYKKQMFNLANKKLPIQQGLTMLARFKPTKCHLKGSSHDTVQGRD